MRRIFGFLAIALVVSACSREPLPPTPAALRVPPPPSDSVESVIFLIGDAGFATTDKSPILHRLRAEVDQWASTMRDSAVIVLWLGDNVYPGGLRETYRPEYVADSTHLQSQLDVVSSQIAKRKGARGIFIAGNHDWGHKVGEDGRRRILNMQEFIDRRSTMNEFLPRDAAPGPAVIDLRRDIELLLFDTAWWLLEGDRAQKDKFVLTLDSALANAKGREVIMAAHHPWTTGAAHGGLVPFWKTFGVKWLLNKSGAALQDINSLPYRDLRNDLTRMFEKHAPPLLFVGGHDHTLQVHERFDEKSPRYSVVSGSASKLSIVGDSPGLLFRRSEPGYMRLVVRKDGAVDLFVVSAKPELLECTGDAPARQKCIDEAQSEFKEVFSVRLKGPA